MARITRYTTKGEQGFIWMPPKIDNPIKKVEIVSDGVTHDIFIETINDCYEVLKKESIGFTHQPFSERLEFVCNNFSTNP